MLPGRGRERVGLPRVLPAAGLKERDMRFIEIQLSSRWIMAGLALAVGLIVGRESMTGLARPAQAAGMMAPIERLIAEDEIRQQVALYGLLADGDGLDRKNVRALADKIMTPDTINEIYPVTGPIAEMRGRDAVGGPVRRPPAPAAATAVPVPPAPPTSPATTAGRHFLVSTYFDEITPTEARTRTTAIHFDMTKNMIGPECRKSGEDACGGRVVKGSMWVYHTIWIKTAEGWQMSANRLRNDT